MKMKENYALHKNIDTNLNQFINDEFEWEFLIEYVLSPTLLS